VGAHPSWNVGGLLDLLQGIMINMLQSEESIKVLPESCKLHSQPGARDFPKELRIINSTRPANATAPDVFLILHLHGGNTYDEICLIFSKLKSPLMPNWLFHASINSPLSKRVDVIMDVILVPLFSFL